MRIAAFVTLGPACVLFVFIILNKMDINDGLSAIFVLYIFFLVFLYPSIDNTLALNNYVKALAQNKHIKPPELGFINTVEELTDSLNTLRYSWDEKQVQLQNAVAENKIIVEILPDALIMLDNDLNIIRSNSSARHLFGHRLGERNFEEVFSNIPNLTRAVRQVAEGLQEGIDLEFSSKGTLNRDIRAQIKRYMSTSKDGGGILVSMHDLTELKQMRRMRADFVANASHEIKTPLASILGFIETLQGPAKGDIQAHEKFLAIMEQQGNRMKRLINDLLSLSRIEASTTVPTDVVDLAAILAEAKRNNQWMADEKNIDILYTEIKEEIPIIADRPQITQVFNNLIENAIKYSDKKSQIFVTLKRTKEILPELKGRAEEAIIVSVKDLGTGIDKNHLPRLTERFYRTDDARQSTTGGSGLGLSIVKHILNRHHGKLDITSELGEGSTFSVYLPIAIVD